MTFNSYMNTVERK